MQKAHLTKQRGSLLFELINKTNVRKNSSIFEQGVVLYNKTEYTFGKYVRYNRGGDGL